MEEIRDEVVEAQGQVEAVPVDSGVSEETSTVSEAPRDAQTDVDKLRSTYDRKLAEETRRSQYLTSQMERLAQELKEREAKIDELAVAGMDETERERYRIEKEFRKRDEIIAALQQEQRQRELEAQVQEWMQRELDKVALVTGAPYAEIEKHAGSPDELWQFAANFTRNMKRKAAAQPTIPSKVTTQRPSQAATGINARWKSMTAQERRDYIEKGRLGQLRNSDL